MAAIRQPNFSRTSFAAAYDADGMRASKSAGGQTTYYLYDGGQPLIEENSAGTGTAAYVRGATFSGAYWGDSGDSFGVELWHSTGGWETWTDDASVTGAAGAYPNGYNNVVNWLVQNAYSWEQNVFLYAQ